MFNYIDHHFSKSGLLTTYKLSETNTISNAWFWRCTLISWICQIKFYTSIDATITIAQHSWRIYFNNKMHALRCNNTLHRMRQIQYLARVFEKIRLLVLLAQNSYLVGDWVRLVCNWLWVVVMMMLFLLLFLGSFVWSTD